MRAEIFSMSQYDTEFSEPEPLICDECGGRIPETDNFATNEDGTFYCGECCE